MTLTDELGKMFIDIAKEHTKKKHKLVFVAYGQAGEEPVSYALECETCGVVLIDADVEENG
jgi:hypothetical protein